MRLVNTPYYTYRRIKIIKRINRQKSLYILIDKLYYMKTRQIPVQLSEELYWKLEEERVKARCDDLSEIIEKLLRRILEMPEEEITELKDPREVIDECLPKEFPNAKGERRKDLEVVVHLMFTKGVSRREAVKIRAKEKGVDSSTVQANITRGFGIDTEELDRRLERVIDCLKNKLEQRKS